MAGRLAMRAARAAKNSMRDELPPRYSTDLWDIRFKERLSPLIGEAGAVLDVGGGARPTVAPAERAVGSTYCGLDVTGHELSRAPEGSYDQTVVADITRREPALEGRFDLAVSWLVLEHVSSLEAAMRNVRAYLQPGGHLVAQLPGAFSVFALLNRAVPHTWAVRIMGWVQGRPAESVFPAHYDRCWHSALEQLMRHGWSSAEVQPLFTGAPYFRFSKAARAVYLFYEEIIYALDARNLAPYYLVVARAD